MTTFYKNSTMEVLVYLVHSTPRTKAEIIKVLDLDPETVDEAVKELRRKGFIQIINRRKYVTSRKLLLAIRAWRKQAPYAMGPRLP